MSNPDDFPNPCYRMSRCEIGLGTRWYESDWSTISPKQQVHRWITPAAAQWVLSAPTMGDLGDNMGKNSGFPVYVDFGVMTSEGMGFVNMCISYRINGGAPQYMNDYYCTKDGIGGGSPPARCEALTQDIAFNYGALNASQVNGSVQKGQFSLRCDRNATVRIYAKGLASGGLLTLNKSLGSRLRIANVAADKGYTAKVWANSQSSYEVSSTLEVSGDVPLGNFSGSTVIVMDIQ